MVRDSAKDERQRHGESDAGSDLYGVGGESKGSQTYAIGRCAPLSTLKEGRNDPHKPKTPGTVHSLGQ